MDPDFFCSFSLSTAPVIITLEARDNEVRGGVLLEVYDYGGLFYSFPDAVEMLFESCAYCELSFPDIVFMA